MPCRDGSPALAYTRHDSSVEARDVAKPTKSRLVLAAQTEEDVVEFLSDWPPISLEGLSAPLERWLDRESSANINQMHLFSDALIELQRLLDEVQFNYALAYMLLRDFAVRNPGAETVPPPAPPPIPVQALALLSASIPPTRASLLTQDLHAEMPGSRYLSRSLAGQLLDGALIRAISALDRLAALVQLAVIDPKVVPGNWFAPILSSKDLKGAAKRYQDRDAWDGLMSLAADEVTQWLRQDIRNGFIHRRRWPSALTSEAVAVYSHFNATGEYVHDERAGLSAPQHLALVRLAWSEMLAPGVAVVRRLFNEFAE